MAAPCVALVACGGTGSADTIDFGDTDSGGAQTSDGESESSGGEDASTGEGTDVPTVVPLSTNAIEAVGPCTPLADDERVLAVGPNAETWLATDTDAGTTVRSFGAAGDRAYGFSTPSPLLVATVLDGDAGAFVTAEGLFTIRGPRIDLLAWSSDPAEIRGLCGDLSVDGDGRVLAEDVFTRDLGQWWRWNAPAGLIGPATSMGMPAGACADRSGAGYVLQGETVWSVRSDFVETLPAFGPASAVVGDDAFGLASLVDGDLWVGAPDEDPQGFTFEAGPATGLAASDGVLYVLAGERVYAMQDEAFAQLTDGENPLGADVLHGAGAGGVVIEAEGELCFAGPAAPIELVGIRPGAHRRVAELDVQILTAGTGLAATLDGVNIPLSVGTDGSKGFATDALDEGWHTLEVSHDATRRVVDFKVEKLTPATWTHDIAPLFEEHCSGAGCHGPTPSSEDRPDLSSYDAWVDLADAVRNRVGASADMPPPGTTDWGVEDTLLVLGWLDAGLPEGE